MTKPEAIAALYDSDHCFLNRDFGEQIAHALGVRPPAAQCETVDPTAFKGLSSPGKKKGDKVFGYDARYLADMIALTLDPTYINPCFGRGSGLRHATGFIADKLGIKTTEDA